MTSRKHNEGLNLGRACAGGAGRLSSSFTQSTKQAQSQLSQLRREYSANQGELRRMQGVLKTAAQGTDAYANAQRRIPQLQDDINRQAFSISAVQKEALGAARSQGQMANASGRAGSALRALSGFGLAAGAGIGVAAGAVALLTKNLNASGQGSPALQTLSVRGIDPTAYQQASNRLRILTGDAATAQRAVGSVAEAGQQRAGGPGLRSQEPGLQGVLRPRLRQRAGV